MDDNKIPYIAFEAEMARHERTIKRLLTALVASVLLLFFEPLAEEFDMSVRQIQNIVYKSQEKIFKHL